MNPILKKLGYKGQNPVLILNAPAEYGDVVSSIESEVHTEVKGKYKFIQAFVRNLEELSHISKSITEALDGDSHLWICYPKGTSKKYKSDCKRENINELMNTLNFQGVSMAAVDEDWSAFRFRNIDYIK